jgi:hypothetical protein
MKGEKKIGNIRLPRSYVILSLSRQPFLDWEVYYVHNMRGSVRYGTRKTTRVRCREHGISVGIGIHVNVAIQLYRDYICFD